MALFSISDLHLALGVNKPMDIFGGVWENYIEKLEKNWNNIIKDDDVVVMPGDFCWAMHLNEAKNDFDFLNSLPGIKILMKGNHDYWWDTLSKLKKYIGENAYRNIHFLQNNSFVYKNIAICGTRFWICPGASAFSSEDEKIYIRELGRAELSLINAQKNNPREIIFFTHYPPMANAQELDQGFLALMNKYHVSRVVYGHVHGNAKNSTFTGEHNGIKFDLVSCDCLEFMPKKLCE